MIVPIIILPSFLEHHFVCTFNRHDMQKHAMKCSLNGISITLSEIIVGKFLSFHSVPHISASTRSPRPQMGVSIQEGYS